MKKVLKNAKVILPERVLYHGGVEIQEGKITRIFTEDNYDSAAEVCLDCKGMFLSPGFIDIHLHGGGGSDFMDGTAEAVETILSTHAKHGTTSFLPTTLSSSQEKVIQALKVIESVQNKRTSGPKILGAHLEGNFLSMKHKGAQDPKYIILPIKENYEPFINSVSNLRMISCAPEVEGALDFIREMSAKGIIMSCAHSDANYQEFEMGVEQGISHITHIFNGCSWIHSPNFYCAMGAAESALLSNRVMVEVISDGRHIPPELIRLIYKIKSADYMHVCTDAMCAAGMPEGTYKLGDLSVLVEDEAAMLPDRTTFAGSVCTGDRAVRTLYRSAGISITDAIKMITATPARLLGVYDQIGSIGVGKAADLNVFDEDINIKYTMIDGGVYNDFMSEL